MNKAEREARNAINAIVRGLKIQLEAQLQRMIKAHMGSFIAHAQAGRGFRINVQIMNKDGTPWDGSSEHGQQTHDLQAARVERHLQLMREDPEELCENCADKHKEHNGPNGECTHENKDTTICRCKRFTPPGSL